MSGIWISLLLWSGVAAVAWIFFSRASMRARARSLLVDNRDTVAEGSDRGATNWLRRWLFLAGFRGRSALPLFSAATILLFGMGLLLVVALDRARAFSILEGLLLRIPGGVGEVFLPFAWGSPFLVVALFSLMPWAYVRGQRQRRVQQVEQDLPLTLDLLATLAEAGLGFDSAVDRLLGAQPPNRPLTREFRQFQADLAGGRPRIDALRRLGARLDVMWFTIFISAVIQAERLGTGLSDVMRIQADDLRSRRRERALGFAMALPAKLVLPLVACFFPAIAVVVLGPVFFQILQLVDGLFRGATG
jgi:tight adherence protein C